MPAITGPVSFRPRPRVLASYERVVADSAHGTWTQPLHAAAWSGLSGASDAPKSTVRAVIAWMPPPEPIGLYDTSRRRSARGGIQAWMSGSTSDDPAPLSALSELSPLEPPHADAPAASRIVLRRIEIARRIEEPLGGGGYRRPAAAAEIYRTSRTLCESVRILQVPRMGERAARSHDRVVGAPIADRCTRRQVADVDAAAGRARQLVRLSRARPDPVDRLLGLRRELLEGGR